MKKNKYAAVLLGMALTTSAAAFAMDDITNPVALSAADTITNIEPGHHNSAQQPAPAPTTNIITEPASSSPGYAESAQTNIYPAPASVQTGEAPTYPGNPTLQTDVPYVGEKYDRHPQPYNLTTKDFSNRDYTNAIFSKFDLAGASFKNSILTEAKFRDARLDGADFRNAQMMGVDFTRASVAGANFSGADLRWAKFNKTNLQNAIYDKHTDFPWAFAPDKYGMVYVDTP